MPRMLSFYIPLGHKNTKGLKKDLVLDKLKIILEDPSIKKVCQNTKYDFIIFKNLWHRIKSSRGHNVIILYFRCRK